MKLAGIYPIVEGYKGAVSPGYSSISKTRCSFNQINASLSYSPFGHIARQGALARSSGQVQDAQLERAIPPQ